MIRLVVIILFFLLPIPVSQATVTYTCGSGANTCTSNSICTISNLNTCIDNASDGDTINIAAGTYSWTPTNSSYVSVDKRVTISGGGYCGSSINDDTGVDCGDIVNPSGSWPVRIDLPSSNDYSIFRVGVTSAGSGRARISGIHITGDNYGGYAGEEIGGFITILQSNIANYRVDNNQFVCTTNNSYNADMWIIPLAYGLMDHNYFNPDYVEGKTIVIVRLAPGEWQGDCSTSHTDPNVWGSDDFTFFEDNTVDRPIQDCTFSCMFLDSWCGARYVVRNNYLQNTYSETHGHSYGSYVRSGYAVEWYNNTSYWSDNVFRYFWFRGGTGLVYDNTHSGISWPDMIQITTPPLDANLGTSPASNWEPHDGNNDWDGNCQANSSYVNATEPADCGDPGVPYPTSYPMIDNVGRGQASGTTPTTIQPQALDPLRIWNNVYAGTQHQAGGDTSQHALNRDVYWCADNSCLWVDTFDESYTPYTYPHPWTGDSLPVPTKPQNVTISNAVLMPGGE